MKFEQLRINGAGMGEKGKEQATDREGHKLSLETKKCSGSVL